MYELMQPIIHQVTDPWNVTARSCASSTRSLQLQTVIEFYGLKSDECMICGQCAKVANAHIWPKHTKGDNVRSMFGLATDDMNHPRNYLRLAKPLKIAFDDKTITIVLQQGRLVLFVWKNSLKNQSIPGTRFSFMDCHPWPFKFHNSHRPYLPILAAHCRNFFMNAFRLEEYRSRDVSLNLHASFGVIEGKRQKTQQRREELLF